MSKNKNKGSNKEPSGEGTASTPKIRKVRGQLAPLPERLCGKARTVLDMATDMAKQLSSRGAPQSACDAAAAFVVQADEWRKIFEGLWSAGWEPSSVSAKAPIVEGDPIKILDEYLARYAFVFEGQPEGSVQLVAGAVVTNGKIVEVMLRDTNGRFYGYAPRRFLAHRR